MTVSSLIQKAKGIHEELLNEFIGSLGEEATLDEIANQLAAALLKYGGILLSGVVDVLSEEFFKDAKTRRAQGLRVKERGRTRIVYTIFGNVELRNDIYEDTTVPAEDSERRCVSPVLEGLGIKPHQKITDGVRRALVAGSVDRSYAKSAAGVGDGTLTRQTVHNCVKEAGTVQKFELPDMMRQVKELQIFLDEDHIALQKDPDGKKSTIVPVGCIAEGIYTEGKSEENPGRRRLLNPVFFTSPDLKSKTLVDEIAAFVETTYDLTVLEKVVVHGDGAGWIGKALDDTLNTTHALDGFHLQRELRRFTSWCFTQKKDRNKLRRKLEKALGTNDEAEFERIVTEHMAGIFDQKVKDKCTKFLDFIKNHWAAASSRFDEKTVTVGSCTESIVQHVLSCRMSTEPRSWSRIGAAVVATWRTAQINGVDLLHPNPDEQIQSPYASHIRKLAAEVAAQPLNWDIFEPVPEAFDRSSGTQRLLGMFFSCRAAQAV